MDAMMGTWVNIPEKTENFEAYADVMKFPEDMKALIRQAQKDYKGKVTKEGDKYTIDAEFAGKTDLQTFQLGVPFVSTALGPEEKTTFTLEGDVLKGVHEIGGKTALSKRYIKDGLLVIESTCDGVTQKYVMKRV